MEDKLTRADIRRGKAASWAMYKLPTDDIEVERVVLDEFTSKEKRRKWGSRTVRMITLKTTAKVPALLEKTPDGKLVRLPMRADRRQMWREAMRG